MANCLTLLTSFSRFLSVFLTAYSTENYRYINTYLLLVSLQVDPPYLLLFPTSSCVGMVLSICYDNNCLQARYLFYFSKLITHQVCVLNTYLLYSSTFPLKTIEKNEFHILVVLRKGIFCQTFIIQK